MSGSYTVLARKYRPRSFDTVVGQDAITRTLRNAIISGRVAHAYLFAGPRGIGKTTTARLLARALRCQARPASEAEPCGACESCRAAAADADVDVIEIDGASNRGIEEIRTLRENVKYAPAHGRYKIYIIDEVHQLTDAAFNALLKTLEEPPPHVVFILATTDPRDIPPTVLSRVQRFDFKPLPADTLARELERILVEEKIPYEPEALAPLVRAAEGSVRDALSLLDTAIAYGEGRLEAEPTAALLGVTAPEQVRAFAAALVGHDPVAALEAVDRAASEGEDLRALVRDVIERLRVALVLKAAPEAHQASLTPAEREDLAALGAGVSLDELLYVLRGLLETDALMRESPHPRVELEIAAVRATRRPVPQAIEEVLRRVDEAEARLRGAGGFTAAPASSAGPTSPADPVQQDMLAPSPAAPAPPRAAVPPRAPAARPAASPAAVAAVDPGEGWARVLDEVNRKRALLGAVLAQVRPGPVVGRALTIVVSGNQFHRERLAEPANQEILTQTLRRFMPGVETFTLTMESEAEAGPTAHPAVQAAITEFEGEVVAVRARSPQGDGQ